MRSNGNDGERFSAGFDPEEPSIDHDTPGHDSVSPPAASQVSRPSRAPKSRARKSSAPKSAALSGPEQSGAAKPSKKAPAKRAKRPSTAPQSRRAPAQAALESLTPPPPSIQAPVSKDPRTTLRDHPDQQTAAKSVRAAVASHSYPPSAPRGREDEISIPPTSSDPPVDLDDRFFAEGEAVHRAHEAEAKRASLQPRVHVDAEEPRVPGVVVPPEHRKKLANYVKIAVGVSAILCLAAGIRVGAARLGPSGGERSAAAAQAPRPSPVQAAVVPVAVAPVTPPPAPAPDPAPAAVVQAAPEEPAVPTKSAKEEKEDARRFLEHGKRKDAIEAGQRSVALDPTDAEAWLILGSAQQDAGQWKEGRESYNQCLKQAKVGPVGECRMMLR